MRIYYKNVGGVLHSLEIDENVTVIGLKEMIRDREGYPIDDQVLMYEGTLNEEKLRGIQQGDLLKISLRLRGGKKDKKDKKEKKDKKDKKDKKEKKDKKNKKDKREGSEMLDNNDPEEKSKKKNKDGEEVVKQKKIVVDYHSGNPNRLKLLKPVPSDYSIASSIISVPIKTIIKRVGLSFNQVDMNGPFKAKVHTDIFDSLSDRGLGKYIIVSGISPTALAEGKSSTTIGISQAIGAHLKRAVFTCLRQPSLGSIIGIKGGPAGGGYSQVIPTDDFNLNLSGDIHSVTYAANFLAAAIDTRIYHEKIQTDDVLFKRLVLKEFTPLQVKRLEKLNIEQRDPSQLSPEEITKFSRLNINPATITVNRVMDVNDRMLRGVTIGEGTDEKSYHSRSTQFDNTAASELMSILSIASSMRDLKERIGRMVVASDFEGNFVTCDDLCITGALTTLLKDAFMPNLMQTVEETPVFVHTNPLADISHGNSSVISDKLALSIVGKNGYVITESRFGSDIGAEKFFNIKCRASGLKPDCVVLVVSIRALKVHGGGPPIISGDLLAPEYKKEDLELVEKGCWNLVRHIQDLLLYKVPVVVSINKFSSDTEEELALVVNKSREAGADAYVSEHWSEGGVGALDLAVGVINACKQENTFEFLYSLDIPIKDKISEICTKIYKAGGVEYSELAEQQISNLTSKGYDKLPICISKTQLSYSTDPNKKDLVENFTIVIQDVKLNSGAGFLCCMTGKSTILPSMPTRPGYFDIDINEDNGRILGLF